MTFYNVSIIDLRCRTFQPIRCMFEEVYFQYHNVATLATLQKMNGCFNPFFFCYLSFMPLCLLGTFPSLHSLMYQKVHGH